MSSQQREKLLRVGKFWYTTLTSFGTGSSPDIPTFQIICSSFYFFKDFIYLFMRDTERHRERERDRETERQREAETQAEGEAGSMQGT